jgi:hypothetical protein
MDFNGVQSRADTPVESFPTGYERRNFLEPLLTARRIELIGWSGFDPVFQHTGEEFARGVADIDNLLCDGKLKSAGLRAIVLAKDDTLHGDTRPIDRVVALLKVENWWESCIDNGVLRNAADSETYGPVRNFIDRREGEMSERIRSHTTNDFVHQQDGHEDWGGDFGQYQYLGYSFDYAESNGGAY